MKKTANDSNWQAIEMLLLQETMKQIGKDGKPDAAINTMLHLMSELIGLNRGRIVLANTDGLLRIHYSYGLTAEQVALGQYYSHEGITGAVYSNSPLSQNSCHPHLNNLNGGKGDNHGTIQCRAQTSHTKQTFIT